MKYDNTNSCFLPETDTEFIKLRQDSKITCLYTLLPPRETSLLKEPDEPARSGKRKRGRPRKEEDLPKLKILEGPEELKGLKKETVRIEQGKDCIYIEDYEEVTAHSKGSYRLNTYRLLDFLIWQLDTTNRLPDGEYMTPLRTKLTLPLDFYVRCCGYNAEISASKHKDTQKELQKDLRLLSATLIGWGEGDVVRILDAGCVRNGQIIATFSERMAEHLLNHCKSMWYPLKLMHLSGKSLLSYSLGRSMALHSSITNNQLRGTDGILSVRSLLTYCRGLPTPEDVRARNGNYRQAIIRPFTEALDKLEEMEIISFNYRSLLQSPEDDDNSQIAPPSFPGKYDDFRKDIIEYFVSGMPEGLQN